MIYKIYNLQTKLDKFDCHGYRFEKVAEYDKRIEEVYRPPKELNEKYRISSFQHTFNARYQAGKEPASVLIQGLEELEYFLIEDIVLLLKLLTCTQVCLPEEETRVLPLRNPDPLIRGGQQLDKALNTMLDNLNKDVVEKWNLNLALVYYFQSFWVPDTESQVMFAAICIELLSNLYNKRHKFVVDKNEYPFLEKFNSQRVTKSMKIFNLLNPLKKLNHVDREKLFCFCHDFYSSRNSVAHEGEIIPKKLEAYSKYLPVNLDENEEIIRKRLYIFSQAKIVQKIIKCLFAEELNYPNDLTTDYSYISEFICDGTLYGYNYLELDSREFIR